MVTKKELESVKAKIVENPENLKMIDWHCETAHCIGGWLETLYPKKYKISNKFIYADQLSRANFPDLNEFGNYEDRNSSLFSVYSWDRFMSKEKINNIYNLLRLPVNAEFDELKTDLKAKFACLAIDSYIEKYSII